jgi:signal peptidase II
MHEQEAMHDQKTMHDQKAMRKQKPEQKTLPWLRWFAVAATVLLLDQLTKLWIVAEFSLGESRYINGIFNLVRAHNEGAAFSFLSDAGGWQRWFLSLISIVVSMVIAIWLTRLPRQRVLEGLALSLILGGALGNLYDRLAFGYVVDFLDFHWANWHFAAFNIADMGISVGAALLIIDGLFFQPASASDDAVDSAKK